MSLQFPISIKNKNFFGFSNLTESKVVKTICIFFLQKGEDVVLIGFCSNARVAGIGKTSLNEVILFHIRFHFIKVLLCQEISLKGSVFHSI